MQSAHLYDDKFVAIGTVKGQIFVYRGGHIKQNKAYEYVQYSNHDDKISALQFIKKSDDEYMLVSFADDHGLNVFCLKQCINLFNRKYSTIQHAEVHFVPVTREILLLKKNSIIIKFKTYLDEHEADMIKERVCNDLEYNIKKTLYSSDN